jgi:hypothetical protein
MGEGIAEDVVAYLFVSHPGRRPSEVKQALADTPDSGIYFVAEFVGAFQVFAALEHDSVASLHAAVDAMWEAGVRSEYAVIVQPSSIKSPKRGSPRYCAMIRATAVRDPFDVLDALDDTFRERFEADEPDHETFWYGAAVVTGPYDLLIDLGTDSKVELIRTIREDLRAVTGIGQTITSLADLPGNEIRLSPQTT